MTIKEFIIKECLTCKKELKTILQESRCFNRNHDIRAGGQFSIPAKARKEKTKIGIALTNAKAGEKVIVRL